MIFVREKKRSELQPNLELIVFKKKREKVSKKMLHEISTAIFYLMQFEALKSHDRRTHQINA